MSEIKETGRYHGIDALRAFAMILGIFLHASIVYKTIPLPVWPADPAAGNVFFDYLYFLIHTFRMPLFFMVAGFFCRLLIQKAGIRGFVRRRWERIGIPFLFSMIFILPFTVLPFIMYQQIPAYGNNWTGNFSSAVKQLFHWNGLAHLWFLYYLILYYAAFLLFVMLLRLKPVSGLMEKITTYWKQTRYPLIWLLTGGTAVTWLLLLSAEELLIPVYTGLFPSPAHLAYYFFFMWIGWLIHIRQDIFDRFRQHALPLLTAGFLLSIPVFMAELLETRGNDAYPMFAVKVVLSVQLITLVFGFTGFFLRFFSENNRVWRYLSDAAYWLYLLHMGIVALLQIVFMYININPLIEFTAITTITLFLTLLTYHFCVRFTIIGHYLHGPRKLQKLRNKS